MVSHQDLFLQFPPLLEKTLNYKILLVCIKNETAVFSKIYYLGTYQKVTGIVQ